ncbi:MAG: family 10 glycosylhydrolase [Akkermansia sp.]|nr:family 10 glycosylhydrolase [Akkermansia sp.]
MIPGMKQLLQVLLFMAAALLSPAWQQVNEGAPEPSREFRAVWVSTVYNLDWPSRAGLPAEQQKQELLTILNKAVQLKLNAVILQVRPNGDAIYRSSIEPWSAWLSGPGVNPGYDPLAFAIQEAHRRGLELHAWFNPFRATISGRPVGRNHISLSQPGLLKKAGSTTILNPSSSKAQQHVLKVILDVVRRYDIDGVHLDDYFYPYPPNHNIRDGKTPAQRRTAINAFVQKLYSSVKQAKPWVRVGISPFGIWQPGYPAGVEAGVNAYEHLACDARKWLASGWVDYLAPQLYWRIDSAQSFPELMRWWSDINPSRPVWPGIASARINSKEDPGRPASEIDAQIDLSRRLARQSAGQLFWSWRSIGNNAGGIQKYLTRRYTSYALPPAMPWCGRVRPARPSAQARDNGRTLSLAWQPADAAARKWAIQAGSGRNWRTVCILPGGQRKVTIPSALIGNAARIAIRPISACGNSGIPAVLAR